MNFNKSDYSDLYGKSMTMEMPTGAGFLYQKMASGRFKWSSMLRKSKFSYESIERMSYIEQNCWSDITIRHAMNGGEAKFTHGNFTFFPDGYRVIDGIQHFYFYDGCYFHQCEYGCDLSKKSLLLKPNDKARDRLVSELGVVHKISSCKWDEKKPNVTLVSKLSKFFNRKTLISEKELSDAILNSESL